MKNYHRVLFFLCAAMLSAAAAQAAHIKDHHAAGATQALAGNAQPALRLGGEHRFVDGDVTARAVVAAKSGLNGAMTPAAAMAGLDKAPAQGFATGAAAAGNTPAAKAGLNNAPATAERIAEPATELLLLVALSALAIAVRRQSPT